MAGRPPKRYEPGELDRTRKHLGEISEREARRMAGVLGGQVGVEKTANEIEEKYRKLGELNRRRSDRFSRSTPTGSSRTPEASDTERGGERFRRLPRAIEASTEETGYFDRLRMDFLASRPEHQVKTRPAAYAAIFSLVVPVRDFVNPRFITDAEALFFKNIENLVLSVRQLLARYAKSPRTLLRVPYYEAILAVIRDWNLEALSHELGRLELHPRRLPMSRCTELCRLLFRPIVRLLNLDPNYHIVQAIKHIYDVDIMSVPKDSPDVAKIKLAYTMSRDNALRVFIDVKQRLYPLLLKLACSQFSAYSDFFREHREEVLSFLSLSPSDLIESKEREEIVPEQKPAGKAETTEGEAEEGQPALEGSEESTLEEERTGFPADVARGLELLDQLFPQAGFKRITEFPDMYPYFQPILKLPRGTELISPEDPLQQIIVIVAFLQEIFYGFQSITFKTIGNEETGFLVTAEKIDNLTGKWHLFLDEIIGKHYVSSLFEYCHQLEEGIATLRASDYASKLESELSWIKRRYFLPNLKAKSFRGLLPNVPADLPRLSETIKEMREVLERIILDVANGDAASMENPWSEFTFTVEAFITRRIRLVLSRRVNREPFLKRRISNVSLVFHTLLVVRVLDYLINDEGSYYETAYLDAGRPLFRVDAGKDGAPLYNVAAEDPFELIDQSERQLMAKAVERRTASLSGLDKTTGMETAPAMTKSIRMHMEDSARGTSFVLLPITLRRYSEIETERGSETAEQWLKKVASVIVSEIRDFEDLPYRVATGAFIVVMPETDTEGALHLAERLADRFRTLEGGAIPISMGIVAYRLGWSLERLLKATQTAIREAAKLPSPAIVYQEPETDRFLPSGQPTD